MPKQQLEQQKNWYVIHTYSGYEDAVAKSLKQRVESLGLEDKIFNVIVPKEKKIKIKRNLMRIRLTVYFFVMLHLLVTEIRAETAEEQWKALLDFYESTNGTSWTKKCRAGWHTLSPTNAVYLQQ